MEEKHMQSVLIDLLRKDNIRLWTEPFVSDLQKIQELAQKYVLVTEFTLEEVISTLESIRADTSRKDEGNKEFKETAVASLELHLPKTAEKRKVQLKTKLDITAQELKKRISEEYGYTHFNLIMPGKILSPGRRLDEQNVKNNSKIMVHVVSSEQEKNELREEEENKRQ